MSQGRRKCFKSWLTKQRNNANIDWPAKMFKFNPHAPNFYKTRVILVLWANIYWLHSTRQILSQLLELQHGSYSLIPYYRWKGWHLKRLSKCSYWWMKSEFEPLYLWSLQSIIWHPRNWDQRTKRVVSGPEPGSDIIYSSQWSHQSELLCFLTLFPKSGSLWKSLTSLNNLCWSIFCKWC